MKNLFVDYELPKPLSDEELKYYMKEIAKGNQQVRKIVIEHNIRLVINQASKKFNDVPDENQELVSVGLIGLIKAVDTFDYNKNFKFSTYAIRCIDNEILMYVRKNKKNFDTIRLDQPISNDEDSINMTQKDLLVDESVDLVYDYERKELIEGIKSSLDFLSDLERKYIMLYFGFINDKEYTQSEIAGQEHVSHSYVSKVIIRAIEKVALRLNKEKLIDFSYSNTRRKLKK